MSCNITLEELRERRSTLENEIQKLIVEFAGQTGICVKEVTIHPYTLNADGACITYYYKPVKVVLEDL